MVMELQKMMEREIGEGQTDVLVVLSALMQAQDTTRAEFRQESARWDRATQRAAEIASRPTAAYRAPQITQHAWRASRA